MMICVAEWLLEGSPHSAERLLGRFVESHQPWRRYGPGTEAILRLYPQYKSEWRELATSMFPEGSHGNGSAMRVAPIGLAYLADHRKVAATAMESSRTTHTHTLAYQGAVLQGIAVATAAGSSDFAVENFLRPIRAGLSHFSESQQNTTAFTKSLDAIQDGLQRGLSCEEMSDLLGTGVAAAEAVPMAIYCFLRHPESYADVIHEAVFIGGDTDTIACMAGAISGAYLGASAIPQNWKNAVREEMHTVGAIEILADQLLEQYARP
jgi:poly(ADP-ribose) glycohydrolase ARH3